MLAVSKTLVTDKTEAQALSDWNTDIRMKTVISLFCETGTDTIGLKVS